jgi:hypothetical protein
LLDQWCHIKDHVFTASGNPDPEPVFARHPMLDSRARVLALDEWPCVDEFHAGGDAFLEQWPVTSLAALEAT